MNKDIEDNIDEIVSRIRRMQADRLAEIKPMRKYKEILNSISDRQAISRTIRSKEVTRKPIQICTLDKMRYTEAEKFAIITNFDMNTVSMVSNPEPDCAIKDHYTAFDYAMKLVER